MSGQQTGSLVGAVIGGIVGSIIPGVGTVAGAMVGGLLGGLAGTLYDTATAPDSRQEQQSLTDLSIQTSTLGAVIPQIIGEYGGIASNIIWAEQKREHDHETSVAGKGGGPAQITVTKTYSISWAHALCDTQLTGPIEGISRVWKAATLVYDRANSPTYPPEWAFYSGTSDQLPDPVIESIQGVGNVPGYPFLCYVVIADDNLGQSGQTPLYTWEIFQDAAGSTPIAGVARNPLTGQIVVAVPIIENLWAFDPTTRERVVTRKLSAVIPDQIAERIAPLAITDAGIVWIGSRGQKLLFRYPADLSDPPVTTDITDPPTSNIVFHGGSAWVVTNQFDPSEAVGANVARVSESGGAEAIIPLPDVYISARLAVGLGDTIWCNAGFAGVLRIDTNMNTIVATVGGFAQASDVVVGLDGHVWAPDFASNVLQRINPGLNAIIATVIVGLFPFRVALASDGAIWALSLGNPTSSLARVNPADNSVQIFTLDANDDGELFVSPATTPLCPATAGGMYVLNSLANTISKVETNGSIVTVHTRTQPADITQGIGGTVWVVSKRGQDLEQFAADLTRIGGIKSVNNLAQVVTKFCVTAGIAESSLDLSDLPDARIRMALVSIQAVRAPLQILADAYRFYMVESQRKLKFREIGSGPVVATIPEGDLDVGEPASSATGAQFDRIDQISVPTRLEVTFVDKEEHWQNNMAPASLYLESSSVESVQAVTYQIALAYEEARQLAHEKLLFLAAQRTGLATTLNRKYAHLEPGDRVEVIKSGVLYGHVVNETSYGRPGLLQLVSVTDAKFARGAFLSTPSPPIVTPPPFPTIDDTLAHLLNLPDLHPNDVVPHYYVSYKPTSTFWPGAALYKSMDGELSFQQKDVGFLREIGGTVAVPAVGADHHVLDTTTVIRVVMNPGSAEPLISVSDLALYNGANLAALCSPNGTDVVEIVGFGTATLVATGTYDLSRLLRGRRGTEYTVGVHGAPELFVLLTRVHTLDMTLAERYVSLPFKVPTLGQELADVESFAFAPTAANLNPWTVAQPQGACDGNDWVFTWYMRSRFTGDWVDNQGCGFDTDYVGYKLSIFTGASYTTTVRIVMTNGDNPLDPDILKTYRYTEAQQIADFGIIQSTLFFAIAQLTMAGESVFDPQMAVCVPTGGGGGGDLPVVLTVMGTVWPLEVQSTNEPVYYTEIGDVSPLRTQSGQAVRWAVLGEEFPAYAVV